MRVAIGAALLLAGCMSDAATGAGEGFDATYRLASIDGAPIEGSADMTIAGRSVTGEGPCNRYMTTNTADWPAVALAPITTTRRACLTEGGEAAFLAAMAQVTRADPVKGGLELSGPAHRLRFVVVK